jgi:rhodanese-related sulfurtransferase
MKLMVRRIDRDEVKRLLTGGAPVVEVLPAKEYRLEHIAGAINIPLTRLDERAIARFKKDAPIVVYCDDYQ